MKTLALAALLATTSAHAALVEVPIGTQTCTLSIDLIRCSGVAPQPTPRPTVAPEPTTVVVGGCPRDALDLDHPFERQPTLRGYDRLRVQDRAKFQFCAKPAKPNGRNGGTLGAAWQDSGFECTSIRIRLVSLNGAPVNQGSTSWTGTPQLAYKLLFGGTAPAGEYFFEVDADSSACADGKGSFMLIWAP